MASNPNVDDPNTSGRWWDAPKDDVHTSLKGVMRLVHDETRWRTDADEYHAGLYSSSDKPGVKGHSRRRYEYGPATLPYNVCQSAVDTLTSRCANHRPLPQVLTQRGNWTSQKKARKLTQFLEGEFWRQEFFERQWSMLIRDALVFGRGILKIWTDKDDITTERVHPWELLVDEWDARYARPRNVYHVRSIDKPVLAQMFARTESGGWRTAIKEAIDQAPRYIINDVDWVDFQNITVDRCTVVEAWHLPSGKGAGDGRHVISVDGATLLDEEWTYAYFPFVVLNYCDSLTGWHGHGLIEQIEGYQYEINLAAEKSSEQHRMSGVGVLVPDGSGIHNQSIRNGITQINHAPGKTPQVFQMDLVNEHTRQRPRELTEDALNSAGLSQMSVQSQKPAGITAAVALQTLDDVETLRFAVFGRACEAAVVRVARLYLDCAKRIAEEYGDHAVSVPMRGGIVDLKWKDVAIDGTQLRIFNTSLLPQQLAARLDRLKDLWNTGLIDRATFLRHLDAPDMQAEMDLETADRLVIDEMIERMLDADEKDGENAFMPPTAYQDFQWAAKRGQQQLNRAMLDGCEEFNLDLLRRYVKQCQVEISKLTTGAPPMGAPAVANGNGLAPPPAATPQAPELPNIGIPGAAQAA